VSAYFNRLNVVRPGYKPVTEPETHSLVFGRFSGASEEVTVAESKLCTGDL